MARHLEFDRMEVLTKAVDAFWQVGYEALPALDIATAMGVAKSSLYNTFGSKRKLFIESVDHYAAMQRATLTPAAKSANVMAVLRQMLLEIASDNNAGRGCLLVNTAAEFGAHDDEIRQHVRAGFGSIKDVFAHLIQAGQAAGQIKPSIDPHQHAMILVTGIAGLRVLKKGGFTSTDLNPVIENMLAGLTQ